MYEVTVPKLRFSRDKKLVSGDPVDIQDKNLAAKLMKKGYVKIAVDNSKKIVSIGASGSENIKGKPTDNPGILGDKNAKDAIAFVESVNSIEELEKLFKEETEGKNRSTVISAIKERASQLDDDDEDDPDNPENTENTLNLNLNPADVIVK